MWTCGTKSEKQVMIMQNRSRGLLVMVKTDEVRKLLFIFFTWRAMVHLRGAARPHGDNLVREEGWSSSAPMSD